MNEEKDNSKTNSDRRKFLKMSLLAGGATVAGMTLNATEDKKSTGEKIKVLTISQLVGEAIIRSFRGDSVTSLFV